MQRLLVLRRSRVFRRIASELLRVYGVDIPEQVTIGDELRLRHHGNNIVVNEHTTIGARVTLYHGVTIGRADASLVPITESAFEHIVIEDDAVIFPGAVVLGRAGTTVIGRGAVIGANAVVSGSVPQWEIWTGNPASCRGRRTPREAIHVRGVQASTAEAASASSGSEARTRDGTVPHRRLGGIDAVPGSTPEEGGS